MIRPKAGLALEVQCICITHRHPATRSDRTQSVRKGIHMRSVRNERCPGEHFSWLCMGRALSRSERVSPIAENASHGRTVFANKFAPTKALLCTHRDFYITMSAWRENERQSGFGPALTSSHPVSSIPHHAARDAGSCRRWWLAARRGIRRCAALCSRSGWRACAP